MKQKIKNQTISVGALFAGIPARHDTTVPEKRNNANQRGITLIALIITIIVMLILAGVVISLTIGERGIFNTAQKAGKEYEIEEIKEQIKLDIIDKQSENVGNISDESLEEILEKYGTLTDEKNILDRTLTTTKGNHKIKVSDIFNGTTVKDEPKDPTFTTVANKPDINGFDKAKTYYVAWNENAEKTAYDPDEKKMSENIVPNNWYDYTNGVNHWANIKTIGGGNDCYWVWIPRYAYKVPTKGGTAETIEIKFLKGTTNTPIDGTTISLFQATEDKKSPSKGDWVVHPAFTNEGNGGFGELTGIWVAKFEASSSKVSAINLENGTLTGDTNSLNGTGGGTDTSLQVRVKPNVTSWRGITLNNIFTVCRNLTELGNSLENTSNLNSHMMKNTEWGAVAYLSSSKYGKTDSSGNRVRVYNNPYYDGTENYSPITGLSGKTATQKNPGIITDLYKYNEAGGGNASTTGNVYGVYDMAGGAWEYVAGILSNNKKNGNNTEGNNYYDFSNSKTYPNKYFDWYAGTSSDRNTNYNANTGKYGDAVYETSSSGNSTTGSWDSNVSNFLFSDYPVFTRGGRAYGGSGAGVFAFSTDAGGACSDYSFRPVVLSSQP